MSEEPENHTVRLLQEMRAEMREMRSNFSDRFDELSLKVDGNTVLLNMVAGVAAGHERRIGAIEKRSS